MQGQKANSSFVVITGLSGSGKTTALKALEDIGFYAVDNLPVGLLPAFVNLPLGSHGEPFKAALGMDLRAVDFAKSFANVFHELSSQYHLELLFLEASEEILLRRYSQTRRDHPLAGKNSGLAGGIKREKEIMSPIREMAGQVLDTSRFNIHELKNQVQNIFSDMARPAGFSITMMSFGFKYGPPPEADIVMDVRFLANPYFDEQLRPLDGLDERVVDYIFKHSATGEFLHSFEGLLTFLLPQYRKEGKTRLTIALGCTGGRHRSVALAEWLAGRLKDKGWHLNLRHRDIHLG